MEADNASSTTITKSAVRKVAVSSFLGNFIEWFDYATYTYFAIEIGLVFFPDAGSSSTLLAFAVFAISFIFRPLGAIFWGSMGDKKGRKWALSVSIFLMAGSAFCIGLLPSYATIGFLAPILLLIFRTMQGFSAAGEYSGAAVFLAEYAPREHRGLYCSLVPASTATGLLVGSTIALIMKAFVPEADLLSWGWRIPFLIAGPLGLIAHYIRTKLEDAPTFKKVKNEMEREDEVPHPIKTVFTKYRRRLVVSFGATMLNSVGFYLVLTYLPTYLTTVVHMDSALSQLATNISLIAYIGFIFISGRLSDRFGRKRMLSIACICFICLSIPSFHLLNSGNLVVVIAVELVMCASLTINDGNIACYQAEMFPTCVRYTGAALGSNLAYATFGGTASLVVTALINYTGNAMSPAYYMTGIAAIALVVMLLAHDYSGRSLDEID